MYKIKIKKSAQKELEQISPPYSQKIVIAIDALAENPRPEGVKKLKGEEDAYRIRVADYRVVYTIEDVIQIIEIQRIRHRKEAYKIYNPTTLYLSNFPPIKPHPATHRF